MRRKDILIDINKTNSAIRILKDLRKDLEEIGVRFVSDGCFEYEDELEEQVLEIESKYL